jgi:hypothetical protein
MFTTFEHAGRLWYNYFQQVNDYANILSTVTRLIKPNATPIAPLESQRDCS